MTSLAAVSCAAALLFLSACAGIRPVAAVDDQGFDVGLHGDWREMGAAIADVFSRRARAAGLPDLTLPHLDAPAGLEARGSMSPAAPFTFADLKTFSKPATR